MMNDVLWTYYVETLHTAHLYSDYWQHFYRDPVEFIKAAPSSSLSQTFVDIATWLNEEWNKEDKTHKNSSMSHAV